MPNAPVSPRLLVCYHPGDSHAARLTIALMKASAAGSVVACHEINERALADLIPDDTHPLALVVVVGPAWGRPAQAASAPRVGRRVRFAVELAIKAGRPIHTLLVGGAKGFHARGMPRDYYRLLDAERPPAEIRDSHWRVDLTERLIRRLPPRLSSRPGASGGGELPPQPSPAQWTEPEADGPEAWHQRLRERARARNERYELEIDGDAVSTHLRYGSGGADESVKDFRDSPPIILGGGYEEAPPAPVPRGATPTTPPPSDVVECTVFAPPEVRPDSSFLVQVFAHLTHEDAAVAALAKEADAEAEKRGSKSLDSEVARGSRLTFHLRVPGMQVDDPVQHLVWRGEPEAVQFGVTAGGAQGSVIGTVTVSQNEVPFGHVKFKLTVAAEAPAARERDPGDRAAQSWARYRKAFISYASKDRDEVLKRVQMLARLKIEFFQDLLSLEPGERWERALYRHIDESDVFFLFWSKAARDSEWVLREIRYALGRRGGDDFKPPEIVPVIIEGPPLVKPPPELDDLHFNDQILYFINRPAGAQ